MNIYDLPEECLMKRILILYFSGAGATKRVAELMCARLQQGCMVDLFTVESKETLSPCIAITKLATKNPCKTLVVFTVGLADPVTTDFSKILDMNFTVELQAKIKIFHLRGGMDYKKLGVIHKGMMAMVRKVDAKKDESERNDEEKLFLETYGKKLDFVDKSTIIPIVEYVNLL